MPQQAPSTPNWSALFTPQQCEVCGRSLMPSGLDWAGQWNNMLSTPLMEGWNRMWGGMVDAWMQAAPWMQQGWTQGMRTAWPQAGYTTSRPSAEGERCARCTPDDCHCRCCVTNADLVVHARVGERRVVPLTVENNLRRRREVELDLSDWTTHGGRSGGVTGQLAGPASFTLEPCEERTVILTVAVTGAQQSSNDTANVPEHPNLAAETPGDAQSETAVGYQPNADLQIIDRLGLQDVDGCIVYYADLRVKGCDIRPVRIAVALLPRDCAAYHIDCRCGCC